MNNDNEIKLFEKYREAEIMKALTDDELHCLNVIAESVIIETFSNMLQGYIPGGKDIDEMYDNLTMTVAEVIVCKLTNAEITLQDALRISAMISVKLDSYMNHKQ